MNITNARFPKYGTPDGLIISLEIEHPEFGWVSFGASPNDVEKHGRDLYTRALAGEFGPIAPYVAPPIVPQKITMRQARLALLGAGLLDDVDAAIASLPESQKSAARIEWEYAASVERGSPFVAQMAQALGLTAAQVDALFTQGAAL